MYLGEHPRCRGYFWAILDIIMRFFEIYSILTHEHGIRHLKGKF